MPVYESTSAGLKPLTWSEVGNPNLPVPPATPALAWMDLSLLGTRTAGNCPALPLPRRASLESRANLLRCFQYDCDSDWNHASALERTGLAA